MFEEINTQLPVRFNLTHGEQIAWDMYFASIAAMRAHPVDGKLENVDIAACAAVADNMIQERRGRY